MKWVIAKLKNPMLAAFGIITLVMLVAWWLGQPMQLIYDPNASPSYEKWDPNR